MNFSRDASAGYLINHLARLFAARLQARIKPLGLSTGVFPIMVHLWETDGLSQRDLVARVGVEQATMANTLSRMERDGLITRHPDPEDARVKRSWLTDKGKRLRAPATTAAMQENADALAGLSDVERSQLLGLLAKAIHTMQNPKV